MIYCFRAETDLMTVNKISAIFPLRLYYSLVPCFACHYARILKLQHFGWGDHSLCKIHFVWTGRPYSKSIVYKWKNRSFCYTPVNPAVWELGDRSATVTCWFSGLAPGFSMRCTAGYQTPSSGVHLHKQQYPHLHMMRARTHTHKHTKRDATF